MAKKDGMLGTKLFGNKTIEDLNKELYEDFVLTKENIDTLLQKGIQHLDDDNVQTTMVLLPNLKALLDTSLKNSANMNQLIAINTKTVQSEKDDGDSILDGFDVKKLMKERGLINKEAGIA